MGESPWYISLLKDELPGVLDVPAEPKSVNAVIRVAHAFALSGLAAKRSTGLLSQLHGLSLDDLAYDCIADLFQQGADGEFQQLRTYFAGFDIEQMEAEQLAVLFRRLVLGKVSNGVFRLYNEIDPVLGRILRNIKLGIASLKSFDETDRFGEPCIAPTLCDELNHLRPVERDQLIEGLGAMISGSERIPDLLSALSVYLRGQSIHSRVVPILQAALAFRELFALRLPAEEQVENPVEVMIESDTERSIICASRAIQTEYERVYIDTEKIPHSTWEAYFAIIETSLRKKFCRDDGSDFSLFRGMQEQVPNLSRKEYQRLHRSKLEHLHRLVEKRFLATVSRN
jgi:hypothetical protein